MHRQKLLLLSFFNTSSSQYSFELLGSMAEQSWSGPSGEETAVPAKSFSRFMDLWPEIRDMIYEYLLVRGKIFVPNDYRIDTSSDSIHEGWSGPQTPYNVASVHGCRYERYRDYRIYEWKLRNSPITTGLLKGASRKVQAETEAIFYGFNHIVMPAGTWRYPCVSVDSAPPLNSVSFAFDMRDCAGNPYTWRRDACAELPWMSDSLTETAAERLQAIHEKGRRALLELWEDRCHMIKHVMQLRYLQLDLEECFCPLGCCRLVYDVFDMLHTYSSVWAPLLQRLDIIGLATEEEAEYARKVLSIVPYNLHQSFVNHRVIITCTVKPTERFGSQRTRFAHL